MILSIAGSDPSGGAGIQADLKTASRLGCYPCSVITVLTAQNSKGVKGIWKVDKEKIKAQLESVFEDLAPDAIKIGLVDSADSIQVIADTLETNFCQNVVLDPVLKPTLSDSSANEETATALMERLFPLATLVTPNLPELEFFEKLSNRPFEDLCEAYLLKGGHSADDDCIDVLFMREYERYPVGMPSTTFPTLNFNHSSLYNQENILPGPDSEEGRMIGIEFRHKRIPSSNTHGTGCILSSAVACFLAKGLDLPQAVKEAGRFVSEALSKSAKFNLTKGGYGPSLI